MAPPLLDSAPHDVSFDGGGARQGHACLAMGKYVLPLTIDHLLLYIRRVNRIITEYQLSYKIIRLWNELYWLIVSVYSFFYNKCVLQMHIIG